MEGFFDSVSGEGFTGEAVAVAVEVVEVAVIGVAVVKAGLGFVVGGEIAAVVAVGGAGAGGCNIPMAANDGHQGDEYPGDEAGEIEHGLV